jgi:hypothetical protein
MDIVNLRSVRAVIGFLLTWALIANSTIFEKKLVKQSSAVAKKTKIKSNVEG